jgi:hypothetical protein
MFRGRQTDQARALTDNSKIPPNQRPVVIVTNAPIGIGRPLAGIGVKLRVFNAQHPTSNFQGNAAATGLSRIGWTLVVGCWELDVDIWHNAQLINDIKNFLAVLSLTPMRFMVPDEFLNPEP